MILSVFFRLTCLSLLLACVFTRSRCAAEQGFDELFDGHSLKGWIGATENFSIVDGVLESKKGSRGNMLTERQYSDFVLRFEFRLTAGANNGLGIRVPRDGDGSYNGIELQILDDSADKYAALKPYQYHGSAYGIAAATRGALRPVGSWNQEEVRCQGRRIAVILNGKMILDIDIDKEAPNGETIDGLTHKNLDSPSGHIGFLCHDDVVSFRNIRIKVLPAKDSN